MSPSSSRLRKLATAGASAAVLLTAASSAQAASVTLGYQCNYPLIGPQPLSVKIDAAIPTSVPAGELSDAFTIRATATATGDTYAGLKLIGAASVSGLATAGATITAPDLNLPLKIKAGLEKYSLPATKQDLVLTATSGTPPLNFKTPGTAKVTVDTLNLNLTARDKSGAPLRLGTPGIADSDGNPNTFDVPCKLDPADQSTTLTSFGITAPGSAAVGVPSPLPAVTPEATPDPSEAGSSTTAVDYAYNLGGSATLKTLIRGSLPLTGSISANLNLLTGAFSGDLKLAKSGATLKALGILPVTATVEVAPTKAVTGTLINGVLKANATVRIKLAWVTLAGIPIAGGTQCQATQLSNIPLTSTDAFFKPLSGGTIAGTFSISPLTGCGYLNGIVSPLTSGSGNAIALSLTPAA